MGAHEPEAESAPGPTARRRIVHRPAVASGPGLATEPGLATGPGAAIFALTGLGAFLVSLDVSIANSLLPAIGRSYGGTNRAALSWVIAAYAIAFAAALVPAGRLADRAGRRRIFLGGLLLFALGSVICGLAPTFPLLVVGRVVQGVGAATASPASLGLLLAAAGPKRRAVYTARWGGMGALGIGLGPVLGGLITTGSSWRWAFLVNVPLVAVAVVVGPRLLTETPRHSGRRLPDPAGAVLLAVSAAALTLGISETTSWGLLDPRTIVAIGAGVSLGAVFVRRCTTVADPVLDLMLLRGRQFALVSVITVLYSCGFFGLLFSFVLFLVSAWHLSLLGVGLALLPMTGVVVVLTAGVGHIADRVGFRPPLAIGSCCMAAGLLLSAAVDRGHSFSPVWVPLVVLIGLGIGLCYPLLSAAAVSGLPAGELAAATAVNQCARQLGAALGVAATVCTLGPRTPTPLGRFHDAWILCALFCALAAATAAALAGGQRSHLAAVPGRSPA